MNKENGKEQLTKKMDFSGAGLKDEKNKIKIERELDEEEYDEEEQKEEKINLNDVKEDKEDDEFTINFNDEKSVNDYTSKRTKKSENKNQEEEETIEDIQNEISEAQKKADDITPDDFYDIAEFIMSLIDATAASALKWWAKDTADSAYALPKQKKDKLTKQLAKILIKYNAKFSIEFMFLIGLCIMYIPAFRLARKTRKENIKTVQVNTNTTPQKSYIEIKKEDKIATSPVVESIFENTVTETIQNNETDLEENKEPVIEIAKPKRKNHRPRKA